MKKGLLFGMVAGIWLLSACSAHQVGYDASGVFETDEVIVAAQVAGLVKTLRLEEGMHLAAGDTLGQVDCAGLALQKEQLEASINALQIKTMSAQPQVAVLQQQIQAQEKQVSVLEAQRAVWIKEKNRVEPLVASKSIPAKQLDDITGQLDVLQQQVNLATQQIQVLKQQIAAQQSVTHEQNESILSEGEPLVKRVAQIQDQIDRCNIVNPLDGVVLTQYVEQDEMVNPGKPLYRLGNLKQMILRAYVTADQLQQVKVGDGINVRIDDGNGGYKSYPGTIEWIAEEAEFTPKTIQTKNERSSQVYAMKVRVQNDGQIKIGMYGEVDFQSAGS